MCGGRREFWYILMVCLLAVGVWGLIVLGVSKGLSWGHLGKVEESWRMGRWKREDDTKTPLTERSRKQKESLSHSLKKSNRSLHQRNRTCTSFIYIIHCRYSITTRSVASVAFPKPTKSSKRSEEVLKPDLLVEPVFEVLSVKRLPDKAQREGPTWLWQQLWMICKIMVSVLTIIDC